MDTHGGQKGVCVGCPGTGVVGGCEPCDVDDGIGLWFSGRAASALNHGVISLGPKKRVLKEHRVIALYNLKRILFILQINLLSLR